MVGDLPERGSLAASECSIRRNGASVAKDETVREIAVRHVTAALCATTLRRCVEMALDRSLYSPAGRVTRLAGYTDIDRVGFSSAAPRLARHLQESGGN